MIKVAYWSPFLTQVATIKAVINSAKSLKKYSKKYEPIIINVSGEFNEYKDEIEKLNIEIFNLLGFSYFEYLPKLGFFKSRISYILVFLISFFPLLSFILKKKPDIFICHLITSLPILISKIVNNKTKYVLRISGLPKLNLIRKFFWKNISNNISKITCPTKQTMEHLKNQKIFQQERIILLKDPIINISKICEEKKRNSKIIFNKNDFNMICVGRLTKQKNFSLIINNFKKLLDIKSNIKLYILGDGEQKNYLSNLIKDNQLTDKIFLTGFKKNVFNYINKSDLFILTSLWEDPGWVLFEAAVCNTLVFSSDCNNGPKEFLENGKNGVLFKNNSNEDFVEKFRKVVNLEEKDVKKKKLI
ncbi:glycosyltransferase, family 1 [alpha proteobacterium HIMB5]|nr:glycosyltransferase, family 1 [alpha proteobacterium HIMB5]